MLKRILTISIIGILAVFTVIAGILIINPKGTVIGSDGNGSDNPNVIGTGELTCTFDSKTTVAGSTYKPLGETRISKFDLGDPQIFRLYDLDKGLNAAKGYVFEFFMINGTEMITKASLTNDTLRYSSQTSFTITAYYSIEDAGNPRLGPASHSLFIECKMVGATSAFAAIPATSYLHGSYKVGTGYNSYAGKQLAYYTVNGKRMELHNTSHQYLDGVAVQVTTGGNFEVNVVVDTHIVFYYQAV